jgi:hypothetical protein
VKSPGTRLGEAQCRRSREFPLSEARRAEFREFERSVARRTGQRFHSASERDILPILHKGCQPSMGIPSRYQRDPNRLETRDSPYK